jgi:hypothetical protein
MVEQSNLLKSTGSAALVAGEGAGVLAFASRAAGVG